MDDKLHLLKSKTFWASVITTLAPLVPGVAPILAAHPDLAMSLVGIVFGALRVVTSKPVTLKK